VLLADTVTDEELLKVTDAELLYRLFNQERVRLFPKESVRFQCGCSRERIASMLVSMGRDEVDSILGDVGAIEVGCEFCNRQYRFDAIDAQALFTKSLLPISEQRH
jgi:molecular chaperone Hsp33